MNPKDGRHSPRKIDAAMAAVLSWEARADAVAAGALKPAPSRIPTGTTMQDGVLIDVTPRKPDGSPIVPPTLPPAA